MESPMEFSISDVVRQNTLGMSEGFPAGVPKSYNWYRGRNDDGVKIPPSNFTAVQGWGQVYQQVGAPAHSVPNAAVEIANAKTYVHIKQRGEWVLVQDQSNTQLTGAHFVPDFAGNAARPMKVTPLAGGSTTFDVPPSGYNDHFWYKARGTYTAGAVDAVYVQMDMRVTDPDLNLVAMVGADWWRDANAPYLHDHSNNPGAGGSNWVKLSPQWSKVGFYSSSTVQFQADLPPPLLESAQAPPLVGSPKNLVPAAPKIVSLMPDTGTVGDKITSASVLTLSGTAEAGSSVRIFDGTTQIGTAEANASGAWSLTTGQLADATHSLTSRAVNAAGNTSPASHGLSVRVDTTAPAAPKITSFAPDSGAVGDGITNAGRLTLSGTAEAGSTVQIFDGATQIGTAKVNGNGAWSLATAKLSNGTHDFTATAADAAGNISSASPSLSVRVNAASLPPMPSRENLLLNGSSKATSARASEWPLVFTGSTTMIEVLWNDSLILLPLIFGAIVKIRRDGSLGRFKKGSS
jgi:hypothetical protein